MAFKGPAHVRELAQSVWSLGRGVKARMRGLVEAEQRGRVPAPTNGSDADESVSPGPAAHGGAAATAPESPLVAVDPVLERLRRRCHEPERGDLPLRSRLDDAALRVPNRPAYEHVAGMGPGAALRPDPGRVRAARGGGRRGRLLPHAGRAARGVRAPAVLVPRRHRAPQAERLPQPAHAPAVARGRARRGADPCTARPSRAAGTRRTGATRPRAPAARGQREARAEVYRTTTSPPARPRAMAAALRQVTRSPRKGHARKSTNTFDSWFRTLATPVVVQVMPAVHRMRAR